MIIAGFLTDGPAIKLQDKLRVGDWIRSIDGHQVRQDIIDLMNSYKLSFYFKMSIVLIINR